MNTAIIGHEKIVEFFENIARSGNLSHAYCLIGPDHIGRRKVAETIAAELLEIPPGDLNLSPDYRLVDRLPDEKTGKLKKHISVEQIRELVYFLGQSAFRKNGCKAAIINDIENLNQSGANSLLKSLEEMDDKTIVFLLVGDAASVLPTILSRARKIFFAPVREGAIFEYLKNNGADDDLAGELARMSRGLPGHAIRWLREPDSLARRVNEEKRFESLFHQPFYQKLQSVEDLFGDKSDHIKARAELSEVLDLWQEMIVARLRTGAVGGIMTGVDSSKNENIAPKELIAMENCVAAAKAGLRENIHPRLLVEDILLQIP